MRIAGIDIGGTSIKAAVFDENMREVFRTAVPTPKGPEAVVDAIAAVLEGQNADMVGVGTAGSVSFAHGTVTASNLDWEMVPLRRMLIEKLHLPVWVDNDAQAALMAEWYDGVCQNVNCAVYLTLGTGIGGAMIVDGKPWRGPNNMGAEFGHMIIHPEGPRCTCGRPGCLEYYASATALRRMMPGRSAKQIIDAAKAGQKDALQVFRAYVRELCIGLNNLVMIFDPEVIVLGGGISGAGAFLADSCQEELERIFAASTDPLYTRVRIARHQNDAGSLGAAILARQKLK